MAARKKRPVMTLNITQDLSIASNSTRILPWVVLAGCEATTDRTTLEQLGVSFILNASSEIKSWFEDDDKFRYLRVPIDDEPTCDARAFFSAAHAFCEDVRVRHLAGERVGLVVHCKTGMSRSSTMLLSHLMQARGVRGQVAQVTGRADCLGAACSMCRALEAAGGPAAADAACANHGMTLRDALSFIRERRPRASPNAGFMTQLVELEGALYGGVVTIDIDRYRLDRFGDVRTFCIGEIDPLVGYTGFVAITAASAAAAAAATDGCAAGGEPSPGGALLPLSSDRDPSQAQSFPVAGVTTSGGGGGSDGTSQLPPRRRLSSSGPSTPALPLGSPIPMPPATTRASSSALRASRGFGGPGCDADLDVPAAAAAGSAVPPLALPPAPAPAPPQGMPVRRPSRLDSLEPSPVPEADDAERGFRADRAMHLTPSNPLLPALRRPSLVGGAPFDAATAAAAAAASGSPGGGLPALGGARRLSSSSTSSGRNLQPLPASASAAARTGALTPVQDAVARPPRLGVLPGLSQSSPPGDARMDSQ